MSKKTWSTILVVVLVVAAAVGIYFATKPAAEPAAPAEEVSSTPSVEPVTEAPTAEPATEAPTAEPATEAPTAEPVTEAPTAEPVTEAPTAEPATEAPAAEQPKADEAVEKAAEAVQDAAAAVAAAAGDKVEEAAAAVAQTAEEVKETAEEAVTAVADKAEEAKDAAAEAAAAVADKTQEAAAEVTEKAEEVVAEVTEKAEEVAAEVTGKVEEVAAEVTEKAEEVAAEVTEKAEEVAAEVMPAACKVKASIWHTFTKGQEEYLAKAVSDFNASQDKYEIELLSQPYDGFLGNVKSAVIAGVGPDIIFNYASEAASYVSGGYLTDLSQYIYDEEIGIEGFDGSLVEGVMNGEVKAFVDGGIHYLPAYTTGPILFYNKTLFDELEIKVPTTWEEMEAAAKLIKEKKGIAALGCDSLTDLVQMFIMETPGAGYIDVEKKEVLFDTPEVRAKIQWLVDMVKEGYFLIKSTGNYFSEDFNAGIVASYIGSSAGFPYIKPADDAFEFAMAPVPAATWYPSWNRGPIVFYYKDDARAQAAYEFVKYFISADVNAGWVEAVTALAPYSWTKETEAYKAYIAQDTLAAQALDAVAKNLNIAGSLPAVEGANVVRDALKAAIEKAALGDLSVDEAWTEAVTVSNAALQGK